MIPCTWILLVRKEMEQRVVETVRARLPDIEGHENMEVKICIGHCTVYCNASIFLINKNYAHFKCSTFPSRSLFFSLPQEA